MRAARNAPVRVKTEGGSGLSRYARLLKSQATLGRTIEGLRQKLAHACKHPVAFVTEYRWEHDNGYGRQSNHIGSMCMICRAIDLWNTGQFCARSDLTI